MSNTEDKRERGLVDLRKRWGDRMTTEAEQAFEEGYDLADEAREAVEAEGDEAKRINEFDIGVANHELTERVEKAEQLLAEERARHVAYRRLAEQRLASVTEALRELKGVQCWVAYLQNDAPAVQAYERAMRKAHSALQSLPKVSP